MKEVSRFHPILVILHWLLAILIIDELIFGYFILAATPSSDLRKMNLLFAHMAIGMFIFTLMIIRFVVFLVTARPPAATTGNFMLDRFAPAAHYGFYVLVLLMVGTGLTTAVLSGINLIVFGGSGAPLPSTLMNYPTRVAHGYIAALLATLITLLVVAALYHQFVIKDGLFGRMYFGRRVTNPSAPSE